MPFSLSSRPLSLPSGRCFRTLHIRFLLRQQLLDGFVGPLRCHRRRSGCHGHAQQGQQLPKGQLLRGSRSHRHRLILGCQEQWLAFRRGPYPGLQHRLQCPAALCSRILRDQDPAKRDAANPSGEWSDSLAYSFIHFMQFSSVIGSCAPSMWECACPPVAPSRTSGR